MKIPDPPLLVITDRRAAKRPVESVAARVFAAGCKWLSLRDKDLPEPERLSLLRDLLSVAERFGALVSVHGHEAGAAAALARGLHLDRRGNVAAARRLLGPEALIGLSAHDGAEVQAAAEGGADYVTYSPVFASISKPGHAQAAGLGRLRALAGGSSLPVIALGGVSAGNAAACLAAGAKGIAVIGSVMCAADPGHAVAEILRAMAPGRRAG